MVINRIESKGIERGKGSAPNTPDEGEKRGSCSYCKGGNYNRDEFIKHYMQFHKEVYRDLINALKDKAKCDMAIRTAKDRDTQKTSDVGKIIAYIMPVEHSLFNKPGYEYIYTIQKFEPVEKTKQLEHTNFLYRFAYFTLFTAFRQKGWERHAQNAGQTTMLVNEYAFKKLINNLNKGRWIKTKA